VESFGKFLARKGVLTQKELEEATQYLVVVGGRLGTNLVDLGYLGIEELDRYLAEHLGVEAPPRQWLEQPRPEALARLPERLARRHVVLPLAVEGKTLHLAMADPHHPTATDEVAFATGLDIRPYILSDAHLAFLRERHLGIEREGRFEYLDPESVQGEAPAPDPGPRLGSHPAASEEVEAAARERVACGLRPLEAEEELIDAETFTSLHSDWTPRAPGAPPGAETVESDADGGAAAATSLPEAAPAVGSEEAGAPPPPSPPLAPAEVAELEIRLARAPDRDVIGDCALRLACTYATAAALFVVRRGVIRGFGGLGPGVPRRTEGLFVPIASDSILAETAAEGQPFRGALPVKGIDEQLFRALGRRGARDAAILPVRIRDRVLNLLYVDNGPHPLAECSIAALGAVCEGIARAYARLILLTKRRHC
jgi:hypothetical protein